MSVIGRLVSGPGVRLLTKLLPEQKLHSYGLTVLTPIRSGPAPGTGAEGGGPGSSGTGAGPLARRDVTHAGVLRAKLRALPNGPDSPLARLPGTHIARWVVLDDVPFEAFPAEEDHLRSRYLLFTSNFDGELDPYLDAMWEKLNPEVMSLYGHCEGFDPETVKDAASFRDYMRRCKIFTTFFFPAAPDLTRDEILRALATQRRVARYIVDHQGETDRAGLRADFDRLVAEVRQAETPTPGAP